MESAADWARWVELGCPYWNRDLICGCFGGPTSEEAGFERWLELGKPETPEAMKQAEREEYNRIRDEMLRDSREITRRPQPTCGRCEAFRTLYGRGSACEEHSAPKLLEEGKMKKGGINREYQIKQRPPDPPPIRPQRCMGCGSEGHSTMMCPFLLA